MKSFLKTTSSKLMMIFMAFNLLFIIVVATLFFLIQRQSSSLLDLEKERLTDLVSTVSSLVHQYHARQLSGELSQEEAQSLALQAIEKLRYDNNNYFWVNDMIPRMIMHPYSPALNGRDLSDNRDSNGKRLFVEFVNVVKKQNAGFVDYTWPRPGGTALAEKLSYVSLFQPWGWVVGTGVYVDAIYSAQRTLYMQVGIEIALILLVYILCLYFAYTNIARPLNVLTKRMAELANNKLEGDVPGSERSDDIGVAARAVKTFQASLLEKERLAKEQEERDKREETARQEVMQKLANVFESRMQHIISAVASASTELAQTAEAMNAMSSKSNDTALSATSSASETTTHVETVAAAAHELYSSVSEISSQVHKANELIGDSVRKVQTADVYANKLGEASGKVREVIQLIADISSQINLLALNATIESARAGESGKGFAVVANEVKNLASQTNKSVEEIERVIDEMGIVSGDIIQALSDVKSSVDKISESSVSIASAVEEQTVATNGIAKSAKEASQGTRMISSGLQVVNQSSSEVNNSSQQVMVAAKELSRQAEDLNMEVRKFIEEVRNS